jgi:hypothetical protein
MTEQVQANLDQKQLIKERAPQPNWVVKRSISKTIHQEKTWESNRFQVLLRIHLPKRRSLKRPNSQQNILLNRHYQKNRNLKLAQPKTRLIKG